MTTPQRIAALSRAGMTDAAIAAILNLTRAEVQTAQLTLSAPARGPYTVDFGPVTIPGALNAVTHFCDGPADLGPGLHLVTVFITLLAVDYGGGDPASGVSIDLAGSPTTTFSDQERPDRRTAFGIPAPPQVFTADPEDPRYVAVGAYITPRFITPMWQWNEDVPDASATFRLKAEVTL